jgi:hypothetical protein
MSVHYTDLQFLVFILLLFHIPSIVYMSYFKIILHQNSSLVPIDPYGHCIPCSSCNCYSSYITTDPTTTNTTVHTVPSITAVTTGPTVSTVPTVITVSTT